VGKRLKQLCALDGDLHSLLDQLRTQCSRLVGAAPDRAQYQWRAAAISASALLVYQPF